MRMSLGHETVEEIINDTLWTVWQKSPDFRGASRVSTWIVGIAYRRALKSLRQARAARAPFTDEFIDMASDVDVAGGNETEQWLECAMAELPVEQRMVMEFAYLMGHSCEEIAQIMHCPVNTVKTRMFHAREKLRVSLPRLAGGAAVSFEPIDVDRRTRLLLEPAALVRDRTILSANDAQRIERHLEDCAACRAELEEQRELVCISVAMNP